jgi:ATP-dependent RNA helicase DBP3
MLVSFSRSSEPAVNAHGSAEEFRAEHKILLSENYPQHLVPWLSFGQATFDAKLSQYISDNGFSEPTPIQSECWPILSAGFDIVGIAQTGSGKTLAFGLPGLQHVLAKKNPRTSRVFMLVICPTRELAQQCAHTLNEVGAPAGLKCVCVHGGVPKDHQRRGLKGDACVCVATPGRLKDLMEEGGCSLQDVTYCVLDEADRMLDMGFEHDVRFILSHTSVQRQTLMFSATWPKSVESIAADLMNAPVKVTIGGEELSSNRQVTQIVEVQACEIDVC